MRISRRNIKNILSISAIPIVLWLYISSTINFHYHKLPDGTVICHSHPYHSEETDSPFESHHHSSITYTIIQQISVISFLLIGLAFLLIKLLYYNDLTHHFIEVFKSHFYYSSHYLRGPPIFN